MPAKKNILIDGTTISAKMDGLSQYTLNIIDNFDTQIANYTLIIRKNECPVHYLNRFKANGFIIEEVKIAAIGPIRDIQFKIYLFRNKKCFDFAYIPSNQFPIFINIPTVYTIHDLIYEEFPEQLGRLSKLKRIYLHYVVKSGLKKANTVIAVSKFTQSEIIRIHKLQSHEKIVVVYEGWEHLLQTNLNENFKISEGKYLLYVGSARGHKNLNNLIEAIQIIKLKLPVNYGVIIAGNTSQLSEKQKHIIHCINEKREIIKLTGWLQENELSNYFSHANAFVFPSLSEGFGIPVLEAFYYNVPIILSNRGSLPEVGGKAAIYFDPTNIPDIADTILNFISNEDEIAPLLIREGKERLKLFSWKEAAKSISLKLTDLEN